jgi:hypothetical protein
VYNSRLFLKTQRQVCVCQMSESPESASLSCPWSEEMTRFQIERRIQGFGLFSSSGSAGVGPLTSMPKSGERMGGFSCASLVFFACVDARES